jgi:pimeloyl-ACP methyl ester carboxylesterase
MEVAMPFKTIPNTNVTYALIAFDGDGRERSDDPQGANGLMTARILQEAAVNPPTHIFFFSHGWKGDVPAAIDQYNRWIKAMTDLSTDTTAMGAGFKPLWIGLHWPSLPWGEDELGSNSFEASSVTSNELLERYVARLGGDAEEVRKLLRVILTENETNAAAMTLPPHVAEAYRRLATAIGRKAGPPGGPPDAEEVPFDPVQAFEAGNEAGVAFGGFDLGGLLGPLRQLSFWKMKNRARSVGEAGMHRFIASLQQALPAVRIHLMGHSFGCIIVSSILGGPGGTTALPRPVDSLVLVQGAFSLWAYADRIPDGTAPGYFNAMIKRGGVRGPIVTTQSIHDTAVGTFYPLAVKLVGQVEFAPELPEFGAVGTYGIQGVENIVPGTMLPETGSYGFTRGKIHNLDSSQFIAKIDGASGAHSDIDGPQVAHAIWQAARA